MPDSRTGIKSLYFIKTISLSIILFSSFMVYRVSAHEKMKKDKTGVNTSIVRFDSIDIDFVKRFAPILHFHPREGTLCCFPSSAESAYPRAKTGRTGKYKTPKVLEPGTPCYFEAFYTLNGFRIKYWFWYNYNDYPSGPDFWGCHPGDWEYMEIYFENEKPSRYIFSNHKGVRSREMQEVVLNDNHVEVWVGKGSHANYESPQPNNISSVLGFSDKIEDGGQIWNTETCLIDIRNTIFCKDQYVGDWGDGKKIFGPIGRINN